MTDGNLTVFTLHNWPNLKKLHIGNNDIDEENNEIRSLEI